MAVQSAYPATLEIDYPDRQLDRVSTLFRIFTIIPIAIILVLLEGGASGRASSSDSTSGNFAMSGIVVLPTLLMIVFQQKYPRWWFDWNLALSRFSNRVAAYFLLLRDEYPSTDEEQAVHLDIAYPNVRDDLNRWLPLVKWLLAIPHYVVLFFLVIATIIVVIIAWFAILFTGRYPRSLFDFVVGVMRWGLRVSAYAFILTTDKYPPFRLSG
jgi:hypothetical protein